MQFFSRDGEYYASPLLRAIQIFLLILIIVGIGLLIMRDTWLPKLVDYILKNEIVEVPPQIETVIIEPVSTTTVTTKPPPIPKKDPQKIDSGIEGIVTIGPVCPVVQYPDDGTCADKPYETTLIITDNSGRSKEVFVSTDAQGYFSKELVPGTYTIRAGTEVTMPSMSPVIFKIVSHERVILNLQFDSGIR